MEVEVRFKNENKKNNKRTLNPDVFFFIKYFFFGVYPYCPYMVS